MGRKLSPQQKAANTRKANRLAAERAEKQAAKDAAAIAEPVVDAPGVEDADTPLSGFINEQKAGQQKNEDAAAAAGVIPPPVKPSDLPDEPTAVGYTIYKSKSDFMTHVNVGDNKVAINFNKCTFFATEVVAKDAGCSLDQFIAAIEAHDRYDIDFIKTAGPGFVKSERVIRWERIITHYDPDREMKVYRGPRAVRNRA